MDFTHIFTCGGPLTRDLARIGLVRDETAFGLFPEFVPHMKRPDALAAVEAMNAIPDAAVKEIVDSIPADWQVEPAVRASVLDFLIQRRVWLGKDFISRLFPQGELL